MLLVDEEPAIPDDDLALVRAELSRHAHLRHHVALADGDAIVICQPDVDLVGLQDTARSFGLMPARSEAFLADRIRRASFSPVLRFVCNDADYIVKRMIYRGHGGWSYPLDSGPLGSLVREYVRKVGTDDFFELM